MLTVEEVGTWTGRVAQDPFGEPLGRIADTLRDELSGAPAWLVVVPGDPASPAPPARAASEGVLVPAAGALASGRRVRVVPTADVVRGAPRVRVGETADAEVERRAADHYRPVLGRATADGGAPRHATVVEPPGAQPRAGTAQERAAIVQALRAAHALEQASLRLLAALRWRLSDEELVHDVALHHKQTNRHAERVRERLDELGGSRLRPLDWLAKLAAYAQAQVGRLPFRSELADVREAHAFEQAEAEAYGRLARLARGHGDERTAALADAIRADEVAMALTLEHSRLWRGVPSEPVPGAPRT
jgi:ferritin-like metal-binding protein YciE